jgi:hypothetical protein
MCVFSPVQVLRPALGPWHIRGLRGARLGFCLAIGKDPKDLLLNSDQSFSFAFNSNMRSYVPDGKGRQGGEKARSRQRAGHTQRVIIDAKGNVSVTCLTFRSKDVSKKAMADILRAFPPGKCDVYVQTSFNGWENPKVTRIGFLHQLKNLPPLKPGEVMILEVDLWYHTSPYHTPYHTPYHIISNQTI